MRTPLTVQAAMALSLLAYRKGHYQKVHFGYLFWVALFR
jgi:hypothetical protein